MADPKTVVVIPSYNSGSLLATTVKAVLDQCQQSILVAIDGSTDGSDQILRDSLDAEHTARVTLLCSKTNEGKGAAVLRAALYAFQMGYSHILCMDADGQHPAERIPVFIKTSRSDPTALIMGRPIFGADVPLIRLRGRKLTIAMTNLETLWVGLGDTLFGMRIYPLEPFIAAMRQSSFARGFDFDPEIAVRMCWSGCRPIQVDAPVRYLTRSEGGISHFKYLRDNIILTLLHFRLIPELVFWRIWQFLPHMLRWRNAEIRNLNDD
ncbi:MAG: glycosyltransferase family 2 protein [Verrucomicrobia bacterium]|nr:glycosyltransferase family 2 protein [Verrucomicrobiota bacterium]